MTWKIEVKPGKDGVLVLRTVADAGDRFADLVSKRIERVLSEPVSKRGNR